VEAPARREARPPKARAVPEAPAEDRQRDVDRLVDQDPAQIVRVDLEVGGGELDRRADAAGTALDDGAPGPPQAAVPPHGHVGPGGEGDGPPDGREGQVPFALEADRGDHEGEA
jgi:hypothetical protein